MTRGHRVLFVSLIVSLLIGAAFWALLKFSPEVSVELTQIELQQQLDPKFPVRKCILSACMQLIEPKVTLTDGSDYIGLETRFVATLGQRSMPGTATLTGRPRYNQSSGSFHLEGVQVSNFKMHGNAPDFDEVVRVRGPAVMAAILNTLPLYSLRSNSKYGAIAKLALRSVQVVGGRLRLVFINPLLLFGKS
jgi:hypothetical protein